MKTSTYPTAKIFALLLFLPCYHLANAQSNTARTPCEEYARRVEELSRACDDNDCSREAARIDAAENSLADAQQKLENAQNNLEDWDAQNKAELDGLPYQIGQAQKAFAELDDATATLINALKNLYRSNQGVPGHFYSSTEIAGKEQQYLEIYPGVFGERNAASPGSKEAQEAEARAQIRNRMSQSANGSAARKALNTFKAAQQAVEQSSGSIQQMEARREALANQRQALISAVQRAEAALAAAERELKNAQNAYNDCLRKQNRQCQELAKMRAAKDSCDRISAKMCPIGDQLEGYHGEVGSGSHQAADEACEELGDAEDALRRGRWRDAEQHAEKAGELADLAESRLATEECVNRLRGQVDALRAELAEAKISQPGDYSEAENEINGLEKLLEEAEDGMGQGDYSFAEPNCTWWPKIPGQIRKIIRKNRSAAYRNALQAAKDQEQAMRAEANARRQEMIRLRRKTDCIEILTLLEDPNGPDVDEQLMILKGELEDLSGKIDQSMDLLEKGNFSNAALEKFMSEVQGHLESAIGTLEKYDKFKGMAEQLQKVVSLFNANQSTQSNAEKFGNLMSLVSDGINEIADKFPILQGIAAYFTYLVDGYSAAVEAILNIAQGQMKDALRGISEHRCEHILGLYNSKGFAGTVEHFIQESAPVLDNLTTPEQRQMANDLIRKMVALRLKECCRKTLSEITPPEQGSRILVPDGAFSCLSMSCDNTTVAAILPPWDNISLTGERMKPGLAAVLKQDKKFPWLPVGAGVVGGGIVTYIVTKDNDGGGTPPTTDSPVATDDVVSVPCGQMSVFVNALANDTGEGITITAVTPSANVEVTIIGGSSLQVAGIADNSFSFTYTITDQEGRNATATVQVNVTDTEGPTISCPPDQSLTCGSDTGTTITGTATATDLCAGNEVTISFSDDASGLTGCSNTGTLLRTFTAIDPSGNSSQCTQTISILNDETPPNITCPPDAAVFCGGNTDPSVTGTASSDDNCSSNPSINFVDDNSGLTGCNGTGNLLRTWTATDDCGFQQSCTQNIAISDETPPTITCPPNVTVECQTSTDPDVTGTATASDDCGSAMSLNHEDDVSGLTGCNNTGQIIRTWTALDDCGNEGTCQQVISVEDTTPPSITCPASLSVECSESTNPSATGSATGMDNCSADISLNHEDDVSGLTGCNGTGSLVRTWDVTDDCGNKSTCSQTITVVDNTPPTIQCPPSLTVTCTSPTDPTLTGVPIVSDNCTTSGLQTSFVDDDSGVINCMGDLFRTWTVMDDCGNTQSCTQIISITEEEAPVITCPENITISCDAETDPTNTGTATVEYQCGSPSAGVLSLSDDLTELVGCSNTGSFIRTWTAKDSCGNESSCEQTITIEDTTAPTVTCPANLTIQCDGSTDPVETGSATGTDNCSSAVEITFTDDTSGQNGCNGTGGLTRIWMATDSCGNEASCEQTILIEDTTAPTITCPANLTIQCDGSIDPVETGSATGTDNCSSAVEITFTDDTSGQNGCNGTGGLLRTWMATDECSNQATCEQTISVEDTTAPTITCPANMAIQCDGNNSPSVTGTATGTDNCSPTVSIVYEDDNSGLTGCSGTGNLLRNWTATDGCNNESTCTQTITIEDTIAPSISCPPSLTVDCNDPIDPTVTGVPAVFDNCSLSPTSTFVDDASGVVNCEGNLSRTWTVTDDCGNSSTCEQVITIQPAPCSAFSIEIIQINSPSSPTANDGSIEAQITDPSHLPPFEIFVDGIFNQQSMLNNFTIENLAVGIYQLQAFDVNGCPSEVISVEVDFPGPQPRWEVNVRSANNLAPDLYFSEIIEHPSQEVWQSKNFVTRSSQTFAWQNLWQKNYQWEVSLSQQAGAAIYENGNTPDFRLVNLLLFTAQERLFYQYQIGGTTLNVGGGLFQKYFTIEKEKDGFAVKDPFHWGLTLSARLTCKMGDHVTYALPLSVLKNYNGVMEMNTSVVFYFDLTKKR